jgi:DNA-binding NtrC family response regulator
VSSQEKILVVDDVASIRRLLCRQLSKEGYRCEEADSARQTLNRLRSSPAALVLLDIKMPGRSGVSLLPKIKSHYPDTAVIMATWALALLSPWLITKWSR